MLSRFERFTYNIDEVSLYWHRIAAAEMKRYGLKGSAAVYLVKLLTFPDGLTAAELVSLTGRDKADVSREVGHLEKAGLTVRVSTGNRSYRAPIVLTETGREVAVAISRKAEQAVDIVGGALTPQERRIFYDAFDKITHGLRELSAAGLPEETERSSEK